MKTLIALTLLTLMASLVNALTAPVVGVRALVANPHFAAVAMPQTQTPKPIRKLPGVEEIRVWLGPTIVDYSFEPNHPALTARRTTLDFSSFDMRPPAPEGRVQLYDVFYSNADGTLNADGAYLTIEAVSNSQQGAGGGNVAEIGLRLSGSTTFEYGNVVASFVTLGASALVDTIRLAIDGNTQTYTTLGRTNTFGEPRRLRITIGFVSSSGTPSPVLSISDSRVDEGEAGITPPAVFTVRSSLLTNSDVSFNYRTRESSLSTAATVTDNDYFAASGTLTIPAGSTDSTITVLVIGDTKAEPDEVFFVTLSNPVGATILDSEGTGVIVSDDLITLSNCIPDVPRPVPGGGGTVSSVTFDDDLIISSIRDHYTFSAQGRFSYEASLSAPCGLSGFVSKTVSPGSRSVECSEGPDTGVLTDSFISSLTGSNVRGTWRFAMSTSDPSSTLVLTCWCLDVKGGSTGVGLQPGRSTSRVFTPQRLTVTALSSGRPIAGGQITFSIRDSAGNSPELSMEAATDSNGRASISYTRSRAGTDAVIAEVRVNGEVFGQAAAAGISWDCGELCPCEAVSQGDNSADSTLNALRQFRDARLDATPRGKRYTDSYYRFSSEAVQIMMFNPMLMLRSRAIIARYMPVIQSMARAEQVTLTRGDLDEIDGLLNSFAAKGSPELQQAIRGICDDLRDPQVHAEFGITMIEGSKREMPAHHLPRIIEQVGGTSGLLGLCVVCVFFLVRRRDKTSRTKATGQLLYAAKQNREIRK